MHQQDGCNASLTRQTAPCRVLEFDLQEARWVIQLTCRSDQLNNGEAWERVGPMPSICSRHTTALMLLRAVSLSAAWLQAYLAKQNEYYHVVSRLELERAAREKVLVRQSKTACA